MSAATQLWLIRHASVDGPRGVIHAADALPLKANLPLVDAALQFARLFFASRLDACLRMAT